MKRISTVAVLVVLLTFATSARADKPSDDVKRLVGTWQGTSGVWRGKPMTAKQAQKCVLVLHPRPSIDLSGGRRGIDLIIPDVAEWKGYACSLYPTSTPAVLNAFKINGLKGHSFAGIYRSKGDSLTICINVDRFGKVPKEFKSSRGSEVLLLTFKRKK